MADKQLTPEELTTLHEQLTAKQRELDDREKELRDRVSQLSEPELIYQSEFAKRFAEREQEIQERLTAASQREDEAKLLLHRAREVDSNREFYAQGLADDRRNFVVDSQLRWLEEEVRRLQTSKVAPVRTVPNNTRVTIKDALAYVTPYDGKSIFVSQFIRSCRRAISMLAPSEERIFLELLRQKLTGAARSALEYTEYSTLTELETHLRNIFDTCRTVNQCKADLEQTSWGNSEPMTDFINRVQALHGNIVYAETQTLNRDLTAEERARIDREAKEAFLNGIPPLLRLQINAQSPRKLDDAFGFAIQMAKTYNRDIERFGATAKASFSIHVTKTDKNNEDLTKNLRSFQPFKCDYCKRTGHTVDRCYRRMNDEEDKSDQSQPKTDDSAANTGQSGNQNNFKCDFCRKGNHSLINCRNFERLEKKRQSMKESGNASTPPSTQGLNGGAEPRNAVPQSQSSQNPTTDVSQPSGSRTSN